MHRIIGHLFYFYLLIGFIYYCLGSYILIQKNEVNITQITDVIKIDTSNNYQYFVSNWSKATSLSAWLKLPGNIQSTIWKISYADNIGDFYSNGLIEMVTFNSSHINYRNIVFPYDADKWGFMFVTINYTSGNIYFYFAGITGLSFSSSNSQVNLDLINQKKIVQKIYVGGDETLICSCSLSQIYIFPNKYYTKLEFTIYLITGGDMDLYLWYNFNQTRTIADISGNQRNPEISDNDIEYYSEEQFIKIQNTSLILRNNLEWFTPSAPSLTISFQCKFISSFTGQVPILKRISNQNEKILDIKMLINSGNITGFSVIFNQTSSSSTFVTQENLTDGEWHFCMLQIICVKGNTKAYFLGRLTNTWTNWGINSQSGYIDANTDIIIIGGPGTNDFWLLKDFRIYNGVFRFDSINNCLMALGMNDVYGPNFNLPMTNKTICSNCNSTYSLFINSLTKIVTCQSKQSLTCIHTCQESTYCDYKFNVCRSCNTGCKTCLNTSDYCLSCNTGYYLVNNTCELDCIIPTYKNSINNTCSSCGDCKTCSNYFDNCTSCLDGYYLNAISNKCDQCSTNCTKCIGISNNCTECTSSTNQIYILDYNSSNPNYQYCRPYIRFTQGYLEVSQFDTLDIYLTFNFTLYSDNIPNLDKLLFIKITDFTTDDFKYSIIQISNTNITFRLNPNRNINQNILTLQIQDPSFIFDSNNRPIITTINNVTLAIYQYSSNNEMDSDYQLMLITGSVIVVGSFPMILSEGLGALWGLIDILQLLFYFIYLNMKLPTEFQKLLIFFKIATLPLPNIFIYFFDFLRKNWDIVLPELDAPSKFKDFGIDALFLRNGLTILFYLAAWFIFIYIAIGINKILEKLIKIHQFRIVIKMMRWNILIRFTLLNVVQLSLAIFLQCTNFAIYGAFYIISIILAGLSCFYLLLFIIWGFAKTQSRLFVYRYRTFKQRYGALTDEFICRNNWNISFFVRNQNIIQAIRKILYIFGFVILYDYVMITLILIMIQSLIMILIIKRYSPYHRKSFNMKTIIQELAILLISLILLMIHLGLISTTTLYVNIADYTLILLCSICFVYNLIFILIDEFNGIKILIKYRNRYCRDKKNNNIKNKKRRDYLENQVNILSHTINNNLIATNNYISEIDVINIPKKDSQNLMISN